MRIAICLLLCGCFHPDGAIAPDSAPVPPDARSGDSGAIFIPADSGAIDSATADASVADAGPDGAPAADASVSCDVFTKAPCISPETCYWDPAGPTDDGPVGYCYAAGTGQTDDPCTEQWDCMAGRLCTGGFCRLVCDYSRFPNDSTPCPAGDTCRQAGSDETVGYCGP